MSILIGELEFQGPFSDFDELSDEPGIYAVLVKNEDDFELVEMDETEQVRKRIYRHPERSAWFENSPEVSVAVHYTADMSQKERLEIKEALEMEFDLETVAV